jgi:subtilisin family serine protease
VTALAAALGTSVTADVAQARMGGFSGGHFGGGHFSGPGAFSSPKPATPMGPLAGPRGETRNLGGGTRIPTMNGKSTDRRPPGSGPVVDRKPPRGGNEDRPHRRPHWPHKPGGTGVYVDVPAGSGGSSTVPPTNRLDGNSQPPAAPANPTLRTGGGMPPAGERGYRPDEVVIEIAGSPSVEAVEQLARRHRLARLESVSFRLTNTTFYRWRIPDKRSVPEVVRALEADASVQSAQPNYISGLQEEKSAGAGDPAQYVFAKLQLLQTHALATGNNVLIAVIDSGIDGSHPELAGMLADTFDAVVVGDKVDPHGTAIAGAIVSHAKLMGIAPAARILAVRAFAPDRPKGEGTSFAILKGLDWAAERGARIINMSFAGPRDPAMARALAAARARGIVLIAAAGNAGPKSPPLFPAADPNVIAVTATDADDRLFKGANWGTHIAIAAPGVDLLLPRPGSTYQMTTGTSFAAAEVSGAVALLLERKPDLDPEAVRRILMSTARDLGPKGFDPQFGAGLIDLYQAVLSLAPNQGPGEVAATTGQNSR